MSTDRLSPPSRTRLARAAAGGFLMGLANLVPGISGGTMLLAAGVYTDFIEAVAEVSRGRLRRPALWLLLVVVGAAAVAIALLAGTIKDLVVDHRWVMYSLFVGLTLGGIPALWRLVRPASRATWVGAAAGFAVMVAIALAQRAGAGTGAATAGGTGMLFVAGLAGAASMILPGISGGYLLLVLGQYLVILSAIEAGVDALRAADPIAFMEPAVGVFLPVAVGVVLGVALVSNLIRYLLRHHRAATLGVLLGLLAGVVVGLWPFQQGVRPGAGDVIRGEIVTEESAGGIDPEHWRLEIFRPGALQLIGSLTALAAGAVVTYAFSRRPDAGSSGEAIPS